MLMLALSGRCLKILAESLFSFFTRASLARLIYLTCVNVLYDEVNKFYFTVAVTYYIKTKQTASGP